MIDPTVIRVPTEHGRIVDRYVSDDPSAPLIALLQNVHCNYEAAIAEAAVMAHLMENYGFDLVLPEGKDASLNTDLKKHRIETIEVRKLAAENCLKSGLINAVNYVDLTTDHDFVVAGVEDMDLYGIQTRLHVDIFDRSKQASKMIEALQRIASSLNPYICCRDVFKDGASGGAGTTAEQRTLHRIERCLRLFLDLINTRLVPTQYDELRRNRRQTDVEGWLGFLRNATTRFGLPSDVPTDISFLLETLEKAERFYQIAVRRREAFIHHIGVHLREYGKDKAIVQVGGFHTAHMSRLMKERGYSFVVVAPVFEAGRDYSRLYRKHAELDLRYVNEGGRQTGGTFDGVQRWLPPH